MRPEADEEDEEEAGFVVAGGVVAFSVGAVGTFGTVYVTEEDDFEDVPEVEPVLSLNS